jgi:hypothetical protein
MTPLPVTRQGGGFFAFMRNLGIYSPDLLAFKLLKGSILFPACPVSGHTDLKRTF